MILPVRTALSWLITLVMGISSGVLLVWMHLAFHSSFAWRIELSPFFFHTKGEGVSCLSVVSKQRWGFLPRCSYPQSTPADPQQTLAGSQLGRQPIWQPSSVHKNKFFSLGLSPAKCLRLAFAAGSGAGVTKSDVRAEEAPPLVKSCPLGWSFVALRSLPRRGLHP